MSTDTNPVLKIAAERGIYQVKERSNILTALLDATFMVTPARQSASTVIKTDLEHRVAAGLTREVLARTVFVQDDEVPTPQILTERIEPAIDLCHTISLNDSSRFTRELSNGDTARINEIVGQPDKASLLGEAISVFISKVQSDEENEAAVDSVELLKKYFS